MIPELYQRYVMNTYAQSLTLVRGKGAKVWDLEGREYLDFLAGIAVNSIGHGHPRLLRALRAQSRKLIHVSNVFYNERQPELARALSERSLHGKCFFCNSGAEANEGLIKLARLWGQDRGRYEVITMRQSFHGRTMATLTATGQDKVQKGFEPLPTGFAYAKFNDLESVRAAITPRTAAVLVEAIQGEGGVLPAAPAFFRGIRELCDRENLLMLCDEVQCGMGRTGTWFAYQAYGVEPDAFSLAKGLGGGFPIGAIVAGPKLSDVFHPGHHATTFGGTPLACAAALAVIETIEEEGLLRNAEQTGALFMDLLKNIARKHSFVTEIRGRGLMIGMALDRPAAGLEAILRKNGLLAIATAGTVIRFLPPLIVTPVQIRKAVRIVRAA
ncbi:MAG: aspartate aminotransferase family protein, partial [Kiritimatiellia bacterium]|nr:aspartate aminotransferase family protein [Kiritimatiellia bacterium]